MSNRRSITSAFTAIVAAAGCGSAFTPESNEQPIVSASAYQALPEVSFMPPLAVKRPTTAPFDASLAGLLTIEVCAVANDTCSGAPFTVISGAADAISASPSGDYTTVWHTRDSDLAAGPVIRLAVVLDGLRLAWMDLFVTPDGKQLRTELTGELIGANGRTVPITFFIGRTPLVATHAMHAQGLSATEIAEVLNGEFGQNATQAATLLKNDGFSPVAVGLALKVTFGLTAAPAAAILDGIGFSVNETALALKEAFEVQAAAAAAILKGIGHLHLAIAGALKDVFFLQAEAAVAILKGLGYLHIQLAEAMKEVFFLQAEAAVAILKGFGTSTSSSPRR